jgi:hypothetical protein
MRRSLPILVASALLLLAGLVHGLCTGRWRPSDALKAAAARVQTVPLTVAGWKGEELPVNPGDFAQAGAQGYWMRSYTDARGDAFTVLLMCGPWGKMSVHTPDLCYRGVGYEMVGEAVRHKVTVPGGEAPAEFWTARFRKQSSAGTTTLRICWTWTADGRWQAPEQPRWSLAGSPFLYKLYVVRDVTREPESATSAAELAFLEALLQELRKSLFAPNAPPGDKL